MAGSQTPLKKMIASYAQELQKKIKVEKIILFGSHSRGEALRESDIDLMIISQDFARMPFLKRLEFLERSWRFPRPIEAIGYTPVEFEELKNGLWTLSEAAREGKVLYEMAGS
jgi:hypothetical protein